MPPRRTVASAIRASAYCPDAAVRHPGFACVQSSLVGTATPDLVYARSSLEARSGSDWAGTTGALRQPIGTDTGAAKVSSRRPFRPKAPRAFADPRPSSNVAAMAAESVTSGRAKRLMLLRCACLSTRFRPVTHAIPPCTLLDVPPSRLPARKSPCREARSASFDVARSRRISKKFVKKYMLRSPKRKLRETALFPGNVFPRLAPRASQSSVPLNAPSKEHELGVSSVATTGLWLAG
jgi:hypothetical protein